MSLNLSEELKRSSFTLASAILASTFLVFVGCSKERQTLSAAPETVSNVSVVSAQTAHIPDEFEAVGTLRAAETSQLAAQMMGNIVEIRVREGDRVQRGQVLAVIDDSQPRAALDRATAADLAAQQEISASDSDFTLAESTFKRYQTLYDRKSVSPQEFTRSRLATKRRRHGTRWLAPGRLSPTPDSSKPAPHSGTHISWLHLTAW